MRSEFKNGGSEAKHRRIKYHVSLESPLGLSFCGGAILSDRHVITAAHCVTDKNNKFTRDKIHVVAGTVDMSRRNESIVIPVENAYIPSKFDLKMAKADIAVLLVSIFD